MKMSGTLQNVEHRPRYVFCENIVELARDDQRIVTQVPHPTAKLCFTPPPPPTRSPESPRVKREAHFLLRTLNLTQLKLEEFLRARERLFPLPHIGKESNACAVGHVGVQQT